MPELTKSAILKFYKRKDIQDAIIEHALHKEIGMQFGVGNFGKRPDVLTYPRDVLELALQDVTSLHSSEEIWENPLAISSDLTKKELNNVRTGWDLILDVDCPDWEISKLTTHLFIKALKENGVADISCKFSGNKGFHIGVPFESFPKEVAGTKTKDMFPECPKKISLYLLNIISTRYITIKDNKIVFDNTYAFSIQELKDKFGEREFLITKCVRCKKKRKVQEEYVNEFVCSKCDDTIKDEKEFITCDKCNILMEKIERKNVCDCGSNEYTTTFDPLSILEIDTILISSRHLYRMPYSFHEKSGLVSLPIDPNKVMEFEKEMAMPQKVLTPMFTFLDRNVTGENSRNLLLQALDFEVKNEDDERETKQYEEISITSPITEEFFPPCVHYMLKGIDDGKKRGLFIMTNFLGKLGWQKNDIKQFITKWNQQNPDQLRMSYINGQLHSFIPGAKLPPNCSNDGYYTGIGICHPDGLCKYIKNPVNYTIARWRRHLRDNEEKKSE